MMKRLMFIPFVVLALLLQVVAAYGTDVGSFAIRTYEDLAAPGDQSPPGIMTAEGLEATELPGQRGLPPNPSVEVRPGQEGY